MKKIHFIIGSALMAIVGVFPSCDLNDNDGYCVMPPQPTALVTVCPHEETVILQLDETTRLWPVNMKTSPFGDKEVRALVNYTPVSDKLSSSVQEVTVHWIDSIRTKMPVLLTGDEAHLFANDPIEIVKDWVTIAEDGYLTLRLRTKWGPGHQKHYVDLLYTGKTEDALEFELRHNANGDLYGDMGDALIAFNLNHLIEDMPKPVTIKLKWHSFRGNKTTEFSLNSRNKVITNHPPKFVNVML